MTTDSRTERPNIEPGLPDPLYIDEDKDVVDVLQKLTGTGDGLSKAMASDRTVHQQGEHGYMIVRVTLDQVTHRPRKFKSSDTGALDRVEVWRGDAMTFVDANTAAVRKAMEAQEKRNTLAKEQRDGVMRLWKEQQAEEAEAAAEAEENADD